MARYKFQFWLNGDKDDELLVAETIDELKQRRSFSAVVRDGIMIVKELREGRVDLLLKLYPWVKDAIAELLPPPEPPSLPDAGDVLEQFRLMLQEYQGKGIPDTRDGGFPMMQPAYKPSMTAGQGSTLGTGKLMSLPTFDDDDADTVLVTKSTANNSGQIMANMLKIAF